MIGNRSEQNQKFRHHSWQRCICLTFLPVLLLLLTQCGFAQNAASPPAQVSAAPLLTYLSDQAGVDVYQVPEQKHLWQFHPEQKAPADSKIVVSHGTVYFATNDLFALDTQTGQQRWSTTFDQPVGALMASNDTVYAAASNTIYAFNAHDGTSLWHQSVQADWSPLTGWFASNILLLDHGLLYASLRHGIQALDPTTGALRWHFDLDPGLGETVSNIIPVGDNKRILILSGSTLDALDEESGHVLWHQNIQIDALKVIGNQLYTVFSSLSPSSSTPDQKLSGLQSTNIETGKPFWRINATIYNGLAAIGPQAIYWAKGHDLSAWSTSNGALLWRTYNTDTYERLTSTNDLAIVETSHGKLNALASTNGHLVWQQESPTRSVIELEIKHNLLCGIDPAGTVDAFSLSDGTALWYVVPGSPVEQLVVD